MDIEIYMPCNPDWLCDGLLYSFGLIGIVGFLIFVGVLYREHRRINTPYKQGKKNGKQ
ncbi:hypothetical protein L4C54_20120 [Vibrio lamellibrachiae]|uniref:hypothetical protein n=1 Tax=Vibrio lamellibrachiae TaxID=2910253 RepID=UPI003D1357E9